MAIKIIRHLTAANDKPAVEFDYLGQSGRVQRGISLTNGLEGQALIDDIEKDCVIAENFSAAGEIVDEHPVGSLAWRMNAEAGTIRIPPRAAKQDDSKQHTPSKPPKPEKARATPSSASASIPTEASPMHAQSDNSSV